MSAARRRQYGTGSVYQRKDGRWIGTLQAGWTTRGTRRTINVSSRISEADCKRKLDAKRRQIEREGQPTEGAGARMTVKTWADVWLEAAAQRLRPNSFLATRSAVQTWIVPTIGRRRLTELTPGDVRAVTDAQRRAGLATSTALRTHVTLAQMLKAAMLEGHAVPARVLLVERPGVNVNDRRAMDVAQAVSVLEVAVDTLPHVSRWVAALLNGIRQGEALGLTWDAVDRRAGVMDISWQLQALPYRVPRDRSSGFRVPDGFEAQHLTGALHLTRPKTAQGRRVVPIVPWLGQALADWRNVAPASPYGLVWPAVDGEPADPKQDLEEWKALQATAGVSHPGGRFYVGHETRHTTVSLLIEAGVDRSVIEAIVGHARLVEGYVHAPTELAADALGRVAVRLGLPQGA